MTVRKCPNHSYVNSRQNYCLNKLFILLPVHKRYWSVFLWDLIYHRLEFLCENCCFLAAEPDNNSFLLILIVAFKSKLLNYRYNRTCLKLTWMSTCHQVALERWAEEGGGGARVNSRNLNVIGSLYQRNHSSRNLNQFEWLLHPQGSVASAGARVCPCFIEANE